MMLEYSVDALEEAVMNFMEVHDLVHQSGKYTDLAGDALSDAAEGIILIACSMPDTDCGTCMLVRAAARGAFSLSELGRAMLETSSEAVADPEKLEASIRRVNGDIVISIIRGLMEHIKEETEGEDD